VPEWSIEEMKRPFPGLRPPCPRAATTGLTAIELLVALTILAVLATIGLPSFHHVLMEIRLKNAVSDFHSVLQLARSEAIMRNRFVVVCPSSDGESCAQHTNWHAGGILFVSADTGSESAAPDALLRTYSSPGSDITATTNHRRRVVYRPNGLASGYNATFTFCDPRGDAHARALVLANSGRVRFSRTQPDGGPLSCPH
jgi:type IV fimbrial biogenesis protein FimT